MKHLSLFVFAAPVFAGAQLPTPTPTPLVGARSIALSPDGKRIAFNYQGDIWVGSAEGGKATPLTNHIEMDDLPIWSPDGKYIAFTSNRTGNNDIFVVPADGGQTKRLTWHSGADVPSDWSPDGKTIIERAQKDTAYNGFYTIDVVTGKTKKIMLDMMSVNNPKFSADGKSIIYTRFGFPYYRARYQGSAASQIWRYDIATGKRTVVRNTGFQNLWPNVSPDGRTLFVTVSEKTPSSSYLNKSIGKNVDNVARTPNVYDNTGKRLTNFVGSGVRFLSVARSAPVAAFENDGDVYTMSFGSKPKKIELYANIDDKTTQEEHLVLTGGATDVSLSPKGDKIAFVVRSEIWMVPTKKGKGPNADDAIQLTDWAGLDESPYWSPDNKTLFFVSDRNGPARLFKMDTETKQVTEVSHGEDVTALQLTPDKTRFSYWEAGPKGGLFTVPVAGGNPTQILVRGGQYEQDPTLAYDWSPDGRYLAYGDVLKRSGYYFWDSGRNVHILDTQTGKSVNVTKLNAQHSVPRFTPDGKYLLIASNRQGDGIYTIPLKAEDAQPTELELKYEKPKDKVKVEIDFDGIEDRIRKLISQAPGGNIQVDPENGEIIFLSEGDIWKASYSGEGSHRITGGGGIGDFDFSQDKSQLVFLRGGIPTTMAHRAQGNPQSAIGFRAEWVHDLRLEHKAAYEQFWRAYNRGFYDPNFHGRDWVALKTKYQKYLPSVGHRNEMAIVLNMMVGELESSHSEVGPAAGNPSSQTTAHVGFSFDYSYDGPGIKVDLVPNRAPGSYAKTKISKGEIVLKINGKPVTTDEALYRDVLNDQVGRELTFDVKGLDGKERVVKYRALSGGEFNNLVFQNLLTARRKYVEAKSGGKLTYVHIAGMGQGELDKFNQQVWQFAEGKKALIIDVRNNGGGNTSDKIIDVLERKPNSYYQLRDEDPILGPGQALDMPMVVMMGETSFSNAEMFPSAMKARGLAKLVGMATPGYVIYTGGFNLVDGTSARMPGTGVFRLDGSPLENMGQQPDLKVDITPEQFFAGEDPQLDAAIDALLKQIK